MPSVPPAVMVPAARLHVVAGAVHGLAAMIPRIVTEAPTIPVAAAKMVETNSTARYNEPRVEASMSLNGAEQALHQARLLHHDAHEDEQRHGGQRLLQHHLVELQCHQVEDEIRPETPGAEHEAQEDEGEGYREADEDREQHHRDHDDADEFRRHQGHLLFLMV